MTIFATASKHWVMRKIIAGFRVLALHVLLVGTSVFPSCDRMEPVVAIVVDGSCYDLVAASVDEYQKAIETYDGKQTRLIVTPPSDSTSPQFIRDTLRKLYENDGLEGAVLVGDVPVPMIRGAQHLTTAFKMSSSMPWEQSSVPSDRYYDDFGLSFNLLKNDGKLWYYELSADGSQRIDCDIYTARIKPSKTDPEHSFGELINEFLFKAAAAKASPEPLDKLFHFGGQGNSSDSFNARIDEDKAMAEQFGDRGLHFINFDEDAFVKARFLSILADTTLDYAHVHTHGEVGTQYLSKEPYTSMGSVHIENAKRFLRNRMRSAKDKSRTKRELIETYDIPSSWIEGWDAPEQAGADSILSMAYDVHIEELDEYSSGVKLLLLDACFNGAFLHDDYIAARYVFGHGSHTLAATANSVNVVQDHWKNELAGLLSEGVCVGNWMKGNQTLESHIFGDPTFHFAAKNGKTDRRVSRPTKHALSRFAKSPVPDLQGFAAKEGYFSGEQLRKILLEDDSMNLRMEAFSSLVRNGSYEDFLFAVSTGLGDSYELIRRMAAYYAELCGEPELLPVIADHYLDPLETVRVRFHLLRALNQYPYENAKAALNAARRYNYPPDNEYSTLLSRLRRTCEEESQEILSIHPAGNSEKARTMAIRAQRNHCRPAAVEPLLNIVADSDEDESMRIAAAEALGWYVHSSTAGEILSMLKDVSAEEGAVAVEIRKTIRRIEDNANL